MNPNYCAPNDFVYLRNDEEIFRCLAEYFQTDESQDPILRMAMGIVRDNDDLFTVSKCKDGYLFTRRVDLNNRRRVPYFFTTDEVAKWLFAFCSRLRGLSYNIVDPLEVYKFEENAGKSGKETLSPVDALRNAMKDPAHLNYRDELAVGIANAMRDKYCVFVRSIFDDNTTRIVNGQGIQDSYIDKILKNCTDVELANAYNIYVIDPEKPIEQYGGLDPGYLCVPEEVLEDILSYGWMEQWDPDDDDEDGEDEPFQDATDSYGNHVPDNATIVSGRKPADTDARTVEDRHDDGWDPISNLFKCRPSETSYAIHHLSTGNCEKVFIEQMYFIKRSFVRAPVMNDFIDKFHGCYLSLYFDRDQENWYYKLNNEAGEVLNGLDSIGYMTNGIQRSDINLLRQMGFLKPVDFTFVFPTDKDPLPGQYTRDIGWFAIETVEGFEVGHHTLSDDVNAVNVAYTFNHQLNFTGTFIRLFDTDGIHFYKFYNRNDDIPIERLDPIDGKIMNKFLNFKKPDGIGIGFTPLPFHPDTGMYLMADLEHAIPHSSLAAQYDNPRTLVNYSNRFVMFAHNHPNSVSMVSFDKGYGGVPIIISIVDALTAIKNGHVVPFTKMEEFRYRFSDNVESRKPILTYPVMPEDTSWNASFAKTYEGKTVIIEPCHDKAEADTHPHRSYKVLISDNNGGYYSRTRVGGPDVISEKELIAMLRDGVIQWIHGHCKLDTHIPEGQPATETNVYLQIGNRSSAISTSGSYEDLMRCDYKGIHVRIYCDGKALITTTHGVPGFYIEPATLTALGDNECFTVFTPTFGAMSVKED